MLNFQAHRYLREHISDVNTIVPRTIWAISCQYLPVCVFLSTNWLSCLSLSVWLSAEHCPVAHYCPQKGNKAYPCPYGTYNNGTVGVAHQCSPCPSPTQKAAISRGWNAAGSHSTSLPVDVRVLLIVFCVILLLLMLVGLALYIHHYKRRSVTLNHSVWL